MQIVALVAFRALELRVTQIALSTMIHALSALLIGILIVPYGTRSTFEFSHQQVAGQALALAWFTRLILHIVFLSTLNANWLV